MDITDILWAKNLLKLLFMPHVSHKQRSQTNATKNS